MSTSAPTTAAAAEKPSKGFAAFYSSMKGHIFSRPGTATRTQAPAMVGARRVITTDPATGREDIKLEWDEGEVIAITEREVRMYRREYAEAVKDGALRKRSAEDFDAYVGRIVEAEQAEAKKAADAAKAKAEAEAKAKGTTAAGTSAR